MLIAITVCHVKTIRNSIFLSSNVKCACFAVYWGKAHVLGVSLCKAVYRAQMEEVNFTNDISFKKITCIIITATLS